MGSRAGAPSGPFVADPGFPIVDGPHYLDVLGELQNRLKPNWYLEIGAFKGASLRATVGNYVAVDPEFKFESPPPTRGRQAHFFQTTSDAFFESGFLAAAEIRPNLAFLDGMHLFEYLLRDFINAESSMAEDGVIVLHDCVPTTHVMAEREWDQERTNAWTGDVWKTLQILAELRPDLKIDVLDAWPTGLVVVRKLDPSSRLLKTRYDKKVEAMKDVSISSFGLERYFGAFDIQASAAALAAIAS